MIGQRGRVQALLKENVHCLFNYTQAKLTFDSGDQEHSGIKALFLPLLTASTNSSAIHVKGQHYSLWWKIVSKYLLGAPLSGTLKARLCMLCMTECLDHI